MEPQINFIQIHNKKTGSRKIAYTDWGDKNNNKVLFCVHGLSRNCRDFDFLAKKLAKDYRVICIDIVGRGKSDWLEKKSQYNYFTYISDIVEFLDQLQISKVDWIGTSMGGIIGMLIALQKPNLINKLILNDIGPFISGQAIDTIIDYIGQETLFTSKDEAQEALKARMLTFGIKNKVHWNHILKHSIYKQDKNLYRFTYDPAIVKKPSAIKRFIGNIHRPKRWLKMPDINLWAIWKKLNLPILVLRGELSDVLSKETLEQMRASKPDINYKQFDNIGHAPMLMDDRQIQVVKDWLVR